MVRRIPFILAVILVLGGLIAYSQYRTQPNRVSGFIEADEIRVGSRVGGRVLAVHVEEGQRVRRDQVLVELEPYDLLEREKEAAESLAALDADYRKLAAGFRPEEVAQAKARHDQLQAELDKLVAGPRPQEIDAAAGRLTSAEAELKLAQQLHKRRVELFDQGAVTREELDVVSEQLAAAEAMVVVRKNELDLLEDGTREEDIRAGQARGEEARQAWQLVANGYRQEEIEQAKAARDAAQAALAAIREQKKELAISSPLEGVIEALDLQQGDLIPAGAPVLSIMDDSRLWVRAYVPENRVALRVGQGLSITVDSFGEEQFQGEVAFIAREAEFTPSNVQTPEERSKQVFRIKVNLLNGLEKLRPGMTADVWLTPPGDEP